MHRFLLPLLLSACGPGDIEYQDHWSSTHELCAFADTIQGDRWSGYDALFPDVTEAFYPSEACVDAVLNDFSADVDSLLELDGLETPYDAVYGGRDLFSTRLGVLLASARALLLLDYGTVGKDLVQKGPISEGYVQEIGEAAEESGVQDLGGAIYNFASSVIERTVGDTSDGRMSFWREERELHISAGMKDGFVPGSVLAHEARHLWSYHTTCQDVERTCDSEDDGGYGFALSTFALLERRLDNDRAREILWGRMENHLKRIEPYLDDQGELLPEWRAWLDRRAP